jgi:hypothetical protein
MRANFGGTKTNPHPELVEGRTRLIQVTVQGLAMRNILLSRRL